jgi:hypothetical protein
MPHMWSYAHEDELFAGAHFPLLAILPHNPSQIQDYKVKALHDFDRGSITGSERDPRFIANNLVDTTTFRLRSGCVDPALGEDKRKKKKGKTNTVKGDLHSIRDFQSVNGIELHAHRLVFDARGVPGLTAYTVTEPRLKQKEHGFYIACVDGFMKDVGKERFVSTDCNQDCSLVEFCVLGPRRFCVITDIDDVYELLVYRF